MGLSLNLLKGKCLVAESRETIAFLLVVLCLLSAAVVLTGWVAPPSQYSPIASSDDTRVAPVPETEHTVDQAMRVEAVVTGNTTAYPTGQELVDEEVYPRSAVDDVTLTASGKAEEAVITYQRLVITYQATLGGDDAPFWTNTSVLAVRDVEEYTDGETVTVRSSINVTGIEDRKQELENDFGTGVSVAVSARVQTYYEYEDPARGETITDIADVGANLVFRNKLLILPSKSDTTSVTTGGGQTAGPADDSAGWINPLASFLFVVFGAGAVGSFVYGGRLDARRTQFELEQARHEEWVTVIDRFESSKPTSTATVHSLGDLVDLAIDEHGRVVYSCSQQAYFFVADDVKYVYEPPVPPSYADEFGQSGRSPDDASSDDPLPDSGASGESPGPGRSTMDDGNGTDETTGLDLEPVPEDTDDDP